jgi:hypothetical protein
LSTLFAKAMRNAYKKCRNVQASLFFLHPPVSLHE